MDIAKGQCQVCKVKMTPPSKSTLEYFRLTVKMICKECRKQMEEEEKDVVRCDGSI